MKLKGTFYNDVTHINPYFPLFSISTPSSDTSGLSGRKKRRVDAEDEEEKAIGLSVLVSFNNATELVCLFSNTVRIQKTNFLIIRPPPGLLPVLGPLERYITPTLDSALLISSRAGADLGRASDRLESDAS